MSYQSTLDYINNPNWQRSKFGLERITELLYKMGNPEKKLKFIHIGGTNGKGSTAACCAAVMQEAGYKTGLYTSPYINKFNERMQVNGEMISDEELERLVDIIRPIADAMDDMPTEFEVITAVAMQYFVDHECDIVVLEVGLGGEFDATNTIETPECAVLTAIGLDHTEVLGDTLEKIATTKSGIIKEGGLVASYPAGEEVTNAITKRCDKVGAEFHMVDLTKLTVKAVELEGCTFDYDGLTDVFIPLAGSYQPYNASLAITVLRLIREKGWNVTDENIKNGLAKVKWPGRFEVLRRDPVFVLDGAHNPHGINATVESLVAHFGEKKLTFVIGVMADKDVEHMAAKIAPLADIFYTAKPHNKRAMEAEALAELLIRHGAKAQANPDIQTAVDNAIDHAGVDGVVIALGSLYFSSDVRNAVQKLYEK